MGRSPWCDKKGLKKGPWTTEDNEKLVHHIQKHGHRSWRALPMLAGLNRCGKSCRLRWTNYLSPGIKRGKFSQEEEQTILHLHSILGNKWSAIASHLPGRTDNEIKNFWNTHLNKKLIQMGFDPMTHQPRTDLFSTLPYLLALANMTDLMDHQSLDDLAVRLQAEAVQLAKIQHLYCFLQSTTSLDTNNSDDQNAITDMEAFKLLNSITNVKDNPVMNCPQLNNDHPASFSHEIASSELLHHSSMLSHYLDPQVSFNSQSCLNNEQGKGTSNFTMMDQGNHTADDSPWIIESPDPSSVPLNVTGNSTSNPEDASSSTSSYAATSSYWPELFFEDFILHEL